MKNTYKPGDRTERETSSKFSSKLPGSLSVDDIRALVKDLRRCEVLEAPYTSNRKRIIDNTSIVDLWKLGKS